MNRHPPRRPRHGGLPDIARLIPTASRHTLDSGLTVVVVPSVRSPVVAHALAYGAGTRNEISGQGGTAHFLEHMMFKGSARFGPGEIDRRTRALGGSNNAFTSHDLTLYYFTFAADRWPVALDLELDRMTALALDPREVDSERQVILEEISMYESEPWDVLDEEVRRTFFPAHAYGRPVLGTRDELGSIDDGVLGAFHRRFYRPENAVLAIVGDVDPDRAVAEAAARFGSLRRPADAPVQEAAATPAESPAGGLRLERRQGELARLLVALPAPSGDDPDHPALRLLLAILSSGRSSRLHRSLVDEGQLCVWVTSDLEENLEPGMVVLAAEAVPGAEPERVEEELLGALERLRREPPTPEELARALRMEVADWLFGHEKVDQMAFLAATSCTLFDLEHPVRYLERMHGVTPEDLLRVARRYLDPGVSSVIGWSYPE